MSSPPPKKLFVFGLGYSASRAARAFHAIGYSVSGTVRSEDAATRLTQLDPNVFRGQPSSSHPQSVFLFDGTTWSPDNSIAPHEALRGVTHLLVSVPTGHSEEGEVDPVLNALRAPLLRATKDSIQWVGYLSTIGVYGETNGLEVDESAPVGSSVPRCQLRIKAERSWLESGLPAHVFRIAGIYGPRRGTVTRARVGAATRIHIPGRKFNRIHVDDIVNVLLASAAQPNPGRIYNVCDDEPAPADEVTAYACELLNVHVPPRLSWEEAEKTMSAMAKSFYAESKICANRRIKDELGVKLYYPTYREGFLAQVLEEDSEAGSDVLFPVVGMASERLVVLVDFGSEQAEAYLALRQIGFQLSRLICQPVVPCSFRFSDHIDPKQLNDLEAKTFEMVLNEHLACRGQKASEVVVLPLFFGKSCWLTEFLPKTIAKVWATAIPVPSMPLTVRVGTCLVDQENVNDDRVAQILLERVRADEVDWDTTSTDVSVVVVDHDTPNEDVHKARELVAQQLRSHLMTNERVKVVDSAHVERFSRIVGPKSDFDAPLLDKALRRLAVEQGSIVVAKMIISSDCGPGEDDDIDVVVDDFRAANPSVSIFVTEALKTHKLLSEILRDRYHNALSNETPEHVLP
ncbi:unnamed protein product [Hyaloperonospora brassicae]|uniref:NAD-dependent epimerase/dehydratase domain-containing protein n=1 Tax=Hyaloperonospora brassicae TaxID=162125 RepID=A0AAV0TV88_HYABA|nr:unnamed protein product [Hyaloperonospora brassicae]